MDVVTLYVGWLRDGWYISKTPYTCAAFIFHTSAVYPEVSETVMV